ncbi:unnamed protein product (macronuclear) [Paramecium tetraurelia]|uniref:SET domain-containing protein n=1 Tax=Paramecium tetraurelia TaxID=5888 RepID=A0D2C2_PARTE|nr:uncharacterized protein GSPATT00012695001 [Paramecium tetraurelia]CAK77189.1 unnamed protein product [Paramecium tetraurelia]|eukprot:XP_001444586.1 hypothetical protein (macronuclear) [Paramecium tetraurelia strain d4-2]
MDKDQETKKLHLQSELQNVQCNSSTDVKLEEIDSFWNYNLKQSGSVNIEDLFQIQAEDNSTQEQIASKLKQFLKPQIENFLKVNRRNVKLIKYPKAQWNSNLSVQTKVGKSLQLSEQQAPYSTHENQVIVHNIAPQLIHQYTNYLKIDQNIKRQETQDLNFKYNFTSELREKYKHDVLKVNKQFWRSQEGVKEMITLNKKYALNQMDFIQIYSQYLYLIEKQNISKLSLEEIYEYLQQQIIKKNVTIEINLNSLIQIYLQLQNNQFSEIKQTIFQKINLIQQFDLTAIQNLSFKSFRTNEYLQKDFAFICNSCSLYKNKCKCKFNNHLAQIKNFLEFCCILNQKPNTKKPQWCLDVIKANAQNQCGERCYKNKNNFELLRKKSNNNELNEEFQPITIDRDPCLLAQIYEQDCMSIFTQARYRYKEIKEQYLQSLKQIQENQDKAALVNYPFNNANLYIPCCHQQDFKCENCNCDQFCSKYCDCQQDWCSKKLKGCACKDRCSIDSKCSCRRDNVECDPLVCKCCTLDSNLVCSNTQILINNVKPTLLGRSGVCNGIGVFARNYIMKDELIILYIGEVLIDDEDEIRDQFDDTFTFYNYSLNDDKYSLESRFCGNESRFINHNSSNLMNCKTRQIFSSGKFQLAIYALKDIYPEQEILLNYNEGDQINRDLNNWVDINTQYWNYRQTTLIGKK